MSILIYIVGAGKYGKALFHYLKDQGFQIKGFLQTRVQSNQFYEDTPIYSLQEMLKLQEKAVFLIALADRNVISMIKMKLHMIYKIPLNQILDYSEFVEDNLLRINKHYCPVCNQYVENFLPGGIKSELFSSHHVIGGGYRFNCICPNCGCVDRTRWLYYVLLSQTSIFDSSCSVLHFAPETEIPEKIKKNVLCSYVTADIVAEKAMLQIDITDIPFREKRFDYVIVNHVLEHIENEKAAVMEIKRVLKDNGIMILSFPICTDMNTYEDQTVRKPAERLKYYGQEDHVRLYGVDYGSKIEQYGFHITIITPKQAVSDEMIDEMGFIPDDIIMLCRKKQVE